MDDKKYVFNGTEVILTGRTAKREVSAAGKRSTARVDTLNEIKPADPEEGSWRKWVRLNELYEITSE